MKRRLQALPNLLNGARKRAHLAQSILHLLKIAILVEVVAQELGTECLEHIDRAGQHDAAQQLYHEVVCIDDIIVTCAVY